MGRKGEKASYYAMLWTVAVLCSKPPIGHSFVGSPFLMSWLKLKQMLSKESSARRRRRLLMDVVALFTYRIGTHTLSYRVG